MYFHSEPASSEPSRVRAPQLTNPAGKVRAQFTASLLSTPFSRSVSVVARPTMPRRSASVPAGAFHTPRAPSMRAISPAIAPLEPIVRTIPRSLSWILG